MSVTASTRAAVPVGLLTLLLTGCSFIAETPPGTANVVRGGQRQPCGRSIWYPLADTASAIAGLTWVLRANSDLADAEPHTATVVANGVAYSAESPGNGGNTDLFRAERAAGYGVMGLFGASAIYGFIVEARCASLRSAALAPPPTPPGPSRRGFPGSVLGFGFHLQPAQAAAECAAKGRDWALEGAVGVCKPKSGTADPRVELTFQLGVSTEIRAVYPVNAGTLNRDYSALFASLRGSYGAPQVEPAPFSTDCAASLNQCLEAGEHPATPVWHWAEGTIELRTAWDTDRALLEIRYTREEAAAQ